MEKHLPLIGGIALGLAALYLVNKIRAAASDASGTAQAVTAGVIDAVGGVGTGAVVSVGEILGIPATSQTQCQKDKAAGDTLAASFSCPAKDFISYWWNK